jgi:hypothetical protein
MAVRRIVNGEMRAYIHWNGRWRHAYIMSSIDQLTITGEMARMLNFKTAKSSREQFQAEKSKFHQKKPASRTQKRSEGA